jgi:3-oxoacyl-[acyl-carrier protein] reductase
MRLDGRRTLILGGGGAGIGRAVTRAYADAGASIAVADVDPARAEAAAVDVRERRSVGHALSGDVRSASRLEAMIEEAFKRLGGLDVLVTVVGRQVAFVPAVRLHEMSDEDWDTIYELNLRYVARAVRGVLARFLAQGTGGTIVSIGSVTGFMAAPRQAAYGAAKAGIASLAQTVAAEYAAEGIRMNVVAAGAIATPAAGNASGDESVDEIPVGRYGSPEGRRGRGVPSRPGVRGITGRRTSSTEVPTRGPFG